MWIEKRVKRCKKKKRLRIITSGCSMVMELQVIFFLFIISIFFFYLFVFQKHLFIYFQREEGREKQRERNINVWLLLVRPLLGTWPTPQACALTGNRTGNPLVHRLALNPLSHTSQGYYLYFLNILQRIHFLFKTRKINLQQLYLFSQTVVYFYPVSIPMEKTYGFKGNLGNEVCHF